MAKFRKKPVVIEAEQYWPSDEPLPEGVVELPEYIEDRLSNSKGRAWIYTLEGGQFVTPGDWIITGIKGEKYPCKPDIFDATYEPVEENMAGKVVLRGVGVGEHTPIACSCEELLTAAKDMVAILHYILDHGVDLKAQAPQGAIDKAGGE